MAFFPKNAPHSISQEVDVDSEAALIPAGTSWCGNAASFSAPTGREPREISQPIQAFLV
jgi:hypothetical protein